MLYTLQRFFSGMNETVESDNGMEEMINLSNVLFEEAGDLFDVCEQSFNSTVKSLKKWGIQFEKHLKPEEENFIEMIVSAFQRRVSSISNSSLFFFFVKPCFIGL